MLRHVSTFCDSAALVGGLALNPSLSAGSGRSSLSSALHNSSSTNSSSSSTITTTQRRGLVKLHTSYSHGGMQLYHQKSRHTSASNAASQYTRHLRAPQFSAVAAKRQEEHEQQQSGSSDALIHKSGSMAAPPGTPVNTRPFVPLSDIAAIELKGDYLLEGGHYMDALRQYGVAAKGYQAAYPVTSGEQGAEGIDAGAQHNQRAMITIKLARAFRLTNKPEAAQANAEHALWMLDHVRAPHLDLICEALLELGQTLMALDSRNSSSNGSNSSSSSSAAGPVLEDVQNVIDVVHSYGDSHRLLRLMPRLARHMGLGQEDKFCYFSPFNVDRVFALGDAALELAEQHYRALGDQAGVVRVLERRSWALDRKLFDTRDTAGKINTWSGYRQKLARLTSGAPPPSELLLYSPSVHQVYVDHSKLNHAPVGREDEVMPGANRRVLDDGNPRRMVRGNGPQRVQMSVNKRRLSGQNTSMSTIFEF